jgi:hypothetical protein
MKLGCRSRMLDFGIEAHRVTLPSMKKAAPKDGLGVEAREISPAEQRPACWPSRQMRACRNWVDLIREFLHCWVGRRGLDLIGEAGDKRRDGRDDAGFALHGGSEVVGSLCHDNFLCEHSSQQADDGAEFAVYGPEKDKDRSDHSRFSGFPARDCAELKKPPQRAAVAGISLSGYPLAMHSLEYLAGKRDGLSKAAEIVDQHLGPEHLKGMQPEEIGLHLQCVAQAIANEIAALAKPSVRSEGRRR